MHLRPLAGPSGTRARVLQKSHRIQSSEMRLPGTRVQDIILGDLIFQVLVGRKRSVRKSVHVSSLLCPSGPCGLDSEWKTGLGWVINKAGSFRSNSALRAGIVHCSKRKDPPTLSSLPYRGPSTCIPTGAFVHLTTQVLCVCLLYRTRVPFGQMDAAI